MLVRLLLVGAVAYLLYWLLKGGGSRKRPKKGPPRLIALERSPYEVLELPEGAGRAAIEAARERLLHEYHPDRVAEMGPEIRETAARMTQRVNEAYEELIRRLDASS